MEYLWTPWRMDYVSGAKGGDSSGEAAVPARVELEKPTTQGEGPSCVFCGIADLPQSRDREKLIVLKAEHNFVILNLYPYNTGHLMVVPYRHTADLPGLEPEAAVEMMELARKMVAVVGAEYKPEGFNLGMNLGRVSGAGVADHLHLHVVPRWAGDTNFMPIIGATKVMPEMPEKTLDRLRGRLAAD